MKCRSVRKMLDEYVYGTLSPRRERKIRAHLSKCAACEDSLEDTSLVHDAIATWPDLPEPEDGLHRLTSRLDFAPPPAIVLRPRRFRHLVLPYVAGLATAAALLLLVGDPFRTTEAPVGAPPALEAGNGPVAESPADPLPGENVLREVDGPLVIVKDGQIEVDDADRRRLFRDGRPKVEAVGLDYVPK
jgi:hypothetical protein